MRRLNFPSALFPAVVIAAVWLTGCAVDRAALKPAELAELRQRYLAQAREDTRLANEKTLRRMEAEWAMCDAARGGTEDRSSDSPHAGLPVYDILVLSGGGDYGAFGAGFLKAWGEVTDPELRRPEFDMVTGVSTGALIAPFAFIGDDPSYERLVDLYSTPNADWFRMRGLLFFLPGNESFMDSDGLRADLDRIMDESMMERIAAGSRQNRVLAVNTTNLDVGAMHPFEVSVEAERAAASGDRKRFIDILMASAAIPAVFPPVVIDGALYVDGGTTSNVLYGANWLSPRAPLAQWRGDHRERPNPKLRFWVIVNNQLGSMPRLVQPTWLSITQSSVATAIRSSTTVALRHLDAQCEAMRRAGFPAEFRYVSIPYEWAPPNDRQFDKDVMESLARLGMKMGADPGSWRTDFVDRVDPPAAPLAPTSVQPE